MPTVGKTIEVSLKPRPEEPKPPVSLAPRTNRHAALEAIFRDSFGASSNGDIVLYPGIEGSKSLPHERPEAPSIKRTLSFSSVSSEMKTPTANVKPAGVIYLYMDCRCAEEDEGKEEYDEPDWADSKLAALEGFSTPPITHAASLSPPPSPRPCNWDMPEEASFPDTLWLPSLP